MGLPPWALKVVDYMGRPKEEFRMRCHAENVPTGFKQERSDHLPLCRRISRRWFSVPIISPDKDIMSS